MRKAMTIAATVAVCVTAVAAAPPEVADNEQLAVVEAGDTFRLSVPVSRLVMNIPRSGFTVVQDSRTGARANPRYFHLEDKARGMIISGWFEPAHLYRGVEPLWKGETEAWKKKGLPKPRNESFVKVEKWDAVLYDMKVPGGSNTHIRAEWVELGTWIDVHISVTTAEPIDVARAMAMDVLRGIQVAAAP